MGAGKGKNKRVRVSTQNEKFGISVEGRLNIKKKRQILLDGNDFAEFVQKCAAFDKTVDLRVAANNSSLWPLEFRGTLRLDGHWRVYVGEHALAKELAPYNKKDIVISIISKPDIKPTVIPVDKTDLTQPLEF